MAGTSTEASAGPPAALRPSRGYIDGCFDIMHSGHYNAIRQAKLICDVLVVGIHSDEEIAENKALPVMRQDERYAMLEHIKWIDEIVYDVPYSPLLSTLERAGADFCIHGDDMPVNSEGRCAYDDMREAGKLRIVKRTEGVSTTDLIGRLLTLSRRRNSEDFASGSIGLSAENLRPLDPDAVVEKALTDVPLSAAGQLVEELARKYNMEPADEAALRRLAEEQARAAMRAELESPLAKLQTQQLRSTAPVQLLASTRRIAEFSTARQPTDADRVVYVSGSFDMFHVGHAQFLKDARSLGTFLCVGVHDDATTSRAKGPSYPVMTLNERVLNVCACKWVDEVVIGAPLDVTADIIKTWNIAVVARGSEHRHSLFSDSAATARRFAIPRDLGIYHEVPSKWPHLCHDVVVSRILKDREVYLSRNLARAKQEDAYYSQKAEGKSAAPQEAFA